MSRIPLFAIMLAVAACVRSAQAAPAPPRLACGLAAEIVRETLAGYPRNVVFSEETQRFLRNLKPRDVVVLRKGARPPSPALVNAFIQGSPRNAVTECAEVRALLNARHAPFGPEATKAAREANGLGAHGREGMAIVSIFLPVVSRDGREALVETGSVCRGLCGGGGLTYYRRRAGGRWEGVTAGPLWMS